MRILVASPGQDTGGMGIRIKKAFDKHGPHTVRAVHSTETYIQYPADLRTYRDPRSLIQKIYNEADVVHCSNSLEPIARWGRGRPKPALVTYQGTAFRSNPEPHIAQARSKGAIQTVSTIDLLTLFDDPTEGRWSPHPIDVADMLNIRQMAQRDDRIVIYHSPTNRRVKSTQVFQEAANRLIQEDRRVVVRIVEAAAWRDNLKQKAQADIVYDQMILGWGTNALEAWAMGIPVIVDTEFDIVKDKMREIIGPVLPNYPAQPDTLYAALRTLVNEPAVREEYARRGMEYVLRFHEEKAAADRLSGLYEEAAGISRAVA